MTSNTDAPINLPPTAEQIAALEPWPFEEPSEPEVYDDDEGPNPFDIA